METANRHRVEAAYCFIHQKRRVYLHSTLDWQRDDIEYAIADYADAMDRDLYRQLAAGKADFLKDHTTFADDLQSAEENLEKML